MFVLAFAFYTFGSSHMKMFYGFLTALIVMIGFVGFWFISAKVPMDGIQVNMLFYDIYYGPHGVYHKNGSSVYFYLSFRNPSNHDTLGFWFENPIVYLNDWRVPQYRVYSLDGWFACKESASKDRIWFGSQQPMIIKSSQNITLRIEVDVYDGEGPSNVVDSVRKGDFVVTMKGLLTVRPYFDASDSYASFLANGKMVWVARPFSVSTLYASSNSSE